MRKSTTVWVLAVLTVLVATGALLATAAAQKASVPKTQDRLAMGEDDVRHLLLVMDSSGTGKITKQEYLKFMEAEFERLDKDKAGELDVRKLAKTNVAANRYTGK